MFFSLKYLLKKVSQNIDKWHSNIKSLENFKYISSNIWREHAAQI